MFCPKKGKFKKKKIPYVHAKWKKKMIGNVKKINSVITL